MDSSRVSQASVHMRLAQYSAFVKNESSLSGAENKMHPAVSVGAFFAEVRMVSFENFQNQRSSGGPVNENNRNTRAGDAVGENGYWGVKKTSLRISEFVLKGAGDDLDRLKAGREGMLKGFKEAEKAWGGSLPDISYATMEKSLQAIDEKIRDLGGTVVDVST